LTRPSDTRRAAADQPGRDDIIRATRLEGLTPEQRQALEDLAVGREGADRGVLLELLRRQPANIYVTVVRRNNQVIVRTSDAQAMQQICELIGHIDMPTPVVLLEVKVLSIDLGDDFSSMFDFQFTDGTTTAGGFSPTAPAASGLVTGNILPPFADQGTQDVRFLPIAPGPIGTAPASNLLFQVVSANFRWRLQLLESKNRVTELASPLLMTANNEVSTIFTGQQTPVTIGFTPGTVVATGVSPATSVAPTPITTLVPVGTTLLITPNINADRSVTLRILQEQSRVVTGGATIPLPSADGAVVNQIPVDTVASRKVSGTFVAKDGLAIAIGGLIEEDVSDSRAEVPVLGKVPYVGFFFRRQFTQRNRRELVFLIRPFVLMTPGESHQASKALVETLSIHPNVQRDDFSTLGSYSPPEVLRPNPPLTPAQNIFRIHTILPKDF
jgi:general secretion pathway protein D